MREHLWFPEDLSFFNIRRDTGEPLVPTAEQSPNWIFKGFVGWNLMVENMLEGVVRSKWMLLN